MEAEPEAPGELKPCPYCGEQILVSARKCKFCREYLDPELRAAAEAPEGFDRMLSWEGTPASAITAGYLGLLSLLPFVGPFAILFGVIALRKLKKNPRLPGRFRAWLGVIMGTLMTIVYLIPVVLLIIEQIYVAKGQRPPF